jgi:hypothetical protein
MEDAMKTLYVSVVSTGLAGSMASPALSYNTAYCNKYAVAAQHEFYYTDGQAAETALAKKLGYNVSSVSNDAERNNRLQPFYVLR